MNFQWISYWTNFPLDQFYWTNIPETSKVNCLNIPRAGGASKGPYGARDSRGPPRRAALAACPAEPCIRRSPSWHARARTQLGGGTPKVW